MITAQCAPFSRAVRQTRQPASPRGGITHPEEVKGRDRQAVLGRWNQTPARDPNVGQTIGFRRLPSSAPGQLPRQTTKNDGLSYQRFPISWNILAKLPRYRCVWRRALLYNSI